MGNNLWPSHLVLKVLGLYLSNFPADWLSLDINWVYCFLHRIHRKQVMQKKTCDYIKETDTFKSTATGESYTSVTCKTKCVVYLIECKRCQMQYVGMTTRTLYFHLIPSNAGTRTNGNRPCNKRGCKTCRLIKTTNTFQSKAPTIYRCSLDGMGILQLLKEQHVNVLLGKLPHKCLYRQWVYCNMSCDNTVIMLLKCILYIFCRKSASADI